MKMTLAQKLNAYAIHTCHIYGFENWRTIWAFRIAEWFEKKISKTA